MSPPFNARTCEASIAQRSRSSCPVARSSTRTSSCSRGHTPASVHACSRRQQVVPEQPNCSPGS
jgi:hypothetical protein